MTNIINYDTIYAVEHSPKSNLLGKPSRIWDLGEDINKAFDFVNMLRIDYPKSKFMLVREIDIK